MFKRDRISLYFLRGLLILGTMTSCGIHLQSGSSGSANDPTPSGSEVYQGNFFGQSGQNASGSAVIWLSGGSYILQLSGVTFPSESGLEVRVVASNSQVVSSFSLRASSGSQNYTFEVVSLKLIQVNIYSTRNQEIYGQAQLKSVTSSSLESFRPILALATFPQNLAHPSADLVLVQ